MSDHLSSFVRRLSSVVHRLSSVVRRPSSVVHRLTPLILLLIVSLACSLPGLFGRPTPTPTGEPLPSATPAAPTPTPQPLPPAIVESDPPAGAELPLEAPITFYFNQPMDRTSVESALRVQPAVEGAFSWRDDTTLVFAPAAPLAPESEITFNLDSGARSSRGLTLPEPLSLRFKAVGYLALSQSLPEPEVSEVDPSSAVVAAFNRPVVPLGADPASSPAAFSLQPEASGRGEWLNTSTYIFYPEPPLEGGKTYDVLLNPDLKGVDGSPLESTEGWRFYTAIPRLSSVLPDTALELRLDSVITMTFNQPMDAASVESSFALLREGSDPVPGQAIWNDDFTSLAFKPDNLLQRSATYSLQLQSNAQARGGTTLDGGYESAWRTVAPLAVTRSDPPSGSFLAPFSSVNLYLSAPPVGENLVEYITIEPAVTNLYAWWNDYDRFLSIYGDFAPDTDYTLTVSPNLSDPWGGALEGGYSLSFRTTPLPPNVTLAYFGTDVLFLTPEDVALTAQVTNFPQVSISVGSVPLGDFFAMVSGPDSYNLRQNYTANNERTFTQNFELVSNRSQVVDLFVSPDRQPLAPGFYYLRINTPGENMYPGPFLIVVGNVHLTFKLSATQALVWAVDLETNTPLPGQPVTIYNENGEAVAQGQTDSQGVFQSEIPTMKDPWVTYYAMLGQPIPGLRENVFGLALPSWNLGVVSWDFGLPTDYSGPRLKAYLYTDRPMYRPGQTVYFRGILREAYNGRYELPELESIAISLYKNYSEELISFDLPLSAFGTFHGEYTLPPDAPPGEYRIASPAEEYSISVNFQVAEYRKPEVNLQVSFAEDQILAGDELQGSVNARYFFDAPAGNLPVKWAWYATPTSFYLPDYQVGVQDTRWLESFYYGEYYDPLGALVLQGESTTDPQGLLTLTLPTEAEPKRMKYTLEVTLTDESGMPVSARATAEANPGEFYIGLRPDSWFGRANQPAGYDVLAVDWLQDPAGEHSLRAEFQKVVWVEEERPQNERFLGPKLVPQYTMIASTDFQTGSDGQARLEFTPPEPGTYMLSAFGEGARSEMYVWVGGEGDPIWPNIPYQRLRLVPDKDSYQPGDTAQVFLPNPFSTSVQALITVERGVVLRHEVRTLEPGPTTLSFPLSEDDAPTAYVAVTLLGPDQDGDPDFRQGYVQINVEPSQQTLNVALTSEPERLGPGEEVTFEVQVSDAAGEPVEGEFSLSVVDLAALALAQPNVTDIVSYFYGEQPLGVRTGLALAAYARRKSLLQADGRGGGGGDGFYPFVVREEFPDTAYWNAEIVTDGDGRAVVSLPLPDSLTTWQVLVRGVSDNTRVGQSEVQVVVTKDLLVRPVTPRFLTAGDHVQLAAVVQNNTGEELQAEVSVQATGFSLDDPSQATQTASIPANGRARIEWWGAVQEVESVDLVFTASANGFEDATRPAQGDLPVLHYTTPQTFATSGTLDEGGERLELVSLPRSFDPLGGDLRVELSSSLGGSMLTSLQALENSKYESTESTLSRFLPNLEAYRALQALGIDAPNLSARLDRTLREGIARLLARQKPDGGWSWYERQATDPYVTAYVLFGLARAREAGANIPETATQRATDFLIAGLYTPDMAAESWQLDRLVFVHFALAYTGSGDLPGVEALFQRRDQLSPWAQALLALAFQKIAPGEGDLDTLYSDVSASAIRSATGAHWEESQPGYQNMSSPLLTTAMVVYSLAQQQPDSPLLPDAVRYLMAHRRTNGTWGSTYTSAWTLMSLVEVMRATGEIGGGFAFSARLNGLPIATGQASGEGAPVVASIPIGDLYTGDPNALAISRAPGSGRLYYTAALNVFGPVEEVAPLQRGVSVQRSYYPTGEACPRGECEPISSARPGDLVRVRVTVTLEDAAYYLLVEDYLPAGTEVLNTNLLTVQMGMPEEEQVIPEFDPRRPFEKGWGWWFFTDPRIYDDHVSWATSYVPAGTYELTYLLVILQPGEYRVLPARSWMFYFPEVQGNSAGEVFTIQP